MQTEAVHPTLRVQADAVPPTLSPAVYYLPTARDRRYAEPAAARRAFRADRSR